jgi:hypothetical protein
MLTAEDKSFITRALAMHAMMTRTFLPEGIDTPEQFQAEIERLALRFGAFCEATDSPADHQAASALSDPSAQSVSETT